MNFDSGFRAGWVWVAFCLTALQCVDADESKKVELVKEPFQATSARAKETGRPLAVFGMTDTCSRCQAVKDALANQPELRLLLTQYEFSQIPFGGREFGEIFQDIVRRDNSIPPQIGAPSLFVFTAKGDIVYAGPNRENGISPTGDELKKLLVAGIEKNGGVRRPDSGKAANAKVVSADLRRVRELLGKNDLSAAAPLLAKHVKPAPVGGENDKELNEVLQLTGLQLAKSTDEEDLQQLVTQVSERIDPLIKGALASAGTDKAIVGAVKLTELTRTFGQVPFLATAFDTAWKELQAKSNDPKLVEQAQLIDKARMTEKNSTDSAEIIAAYRLVTTTFPDTQAAKLSQQRIDQLTPKKPAPQRLWKSKSGKFTITATLLSFDGTTAQLQTSEGKTIEVAANALSAEDQSFLESSKKD